MTGKKKSAPEDACINQADGPVVTGQCKIFDCSLQNITAVCEELSRNGIALQNASGAAQREVLLRALQFRGSKGINTFEGTAAGFLRTATRVLEIKRAWNIYTLREDVIGPDGLLHKGIARYVLMGRRQDVPAAPPAQHMLPAVRAHT